MENILILDLFRGVHLLCVVIGMGPAIYYDLRSLQRIAHPMSHHDLEELHRIHHLIAIACGGLWISGAFLIWTRTNFDLAEFSPKLWCKVIIVTTLTANAVVLSMVMIPRLSRLIGVRLIDLPVRQLLPMTVCAGVSLSCWILALMLGSSQTLKTAGWDILVPVMLEGVAICLGGVLVVMFAARAILRRAKPTPTISS